MTSTKCTILTIKLASEVPTKPINNKPTLVYWDVIGIVHPLRMILAQADVEWYDVRMICGTSGEDSKANKKEWYQAKTSLRQNGILDFPNLPYYLDESVNLVQTDAILRYLGNKYNLMNGPQQAHITDMLLEEARDLDDTMVRLSYEQGGNAVAEWLRSDELRDKLTIWEGYINNTSSLVTGDNLTVVDLKLYTFLYKFQHAQASLMVSSLMASSSSSSSCNTPALPFWVPAYMERVKNASPQLKTYLDSPDMKIPINNPHAKFDNF